MQCPGRPRSPAGGARPTACSGSTPRRSLRHMRTRQSIRRTWRRAARAPSAGPSTGRARSDRSTRWPDRASCIAGTRTERIGRARLRPSLAPRDPPPGSRRIGRRPRTKDGRTRCASGRSSQVRRPAFSRDCEAADACPRHSRRPTRTRRTRATRDTTATRRAIDDRPFERASRASIVELAPSSKARNVVPLDRQNTPAAKRAASEGPGTRGESFSSAAARPRRRGRLSRSSPLPPLRAPPPDVRASA